MRHHVGGHTYRDTTAAVHQQLWNSCRQHRWFTQTVIEVELKIDRVFFDVFHHGFRELLHTDLRITHCSWWIPTLATKISLAIYKAIAHIPCLGHTNDRVINRRISMRMVSAHHITHNTGRFFIRLVTVIAHFIHTKQAAPVNRLQTIAYIGQCTTDDHTHRIIDIRGLHLLLDIHRYDLTPVASATMIWQ